MVTDKDIERANDILQEIRLSRGECPRCEEPLEHFSGLEGLPEYDYCPRCMDYAYYDNGERVRLE